MPSDTRFVSAAELLRVDDRAAAERLAPADLLARVAESADPGTFLRDRGLASDGELRIRRTFIESTPLTPDQMAVRYRTEWVAGGTPDAASAGIHSLELARTPAGWAVRDADLGGLGGGHILPPGPA